MPASAASAAAATASLARSEAIRPARAASSAAAAAERPERAPSEAVLEEVLETRLLVVFGVSYVAYPDWLDDNHGGGRESSLSYSSQRDLSYGLRLEKTRKRNWGRFRRVKEVR